MPPSGSHELRRFPKGESCDECNARRWYLDSGFRYCERGHRIESFILFDHEDEDNFGNRGQVTKKRKEVREKEARHLKGAHASELFLECLQLLLRKQIAWLQQYHEQHYQIQQPSQASQAWPPSIHTTPEVLPPIAALESVVKDLWELRIRTFFGLTETIESRSRSRSRSRSVSRPGSTAGNSTDGESSGMTLYSSQAESDTGYSSAGGYLSGSSVGRGRTKGRRERKPRSRSARSWRSAPDETWNVPHVIETLSLCYLGSVLLRMPYRIGDFYRWAKNNQIPFLGANDYIPKPMLERLPVAYQTALMTRTAPFAGGELHQAVLDLVRGYHLNNELKFPGLNVPPILWRYIRELGLPIEVFVGVQEIARLPQEEFCFPLERTKVFGLDHPDIFLLSAIVFVTKLLFPFSEDGRNRIAQGTEEDGNKETHEPGPMLHMNWKKWQVLHKNPEDENTDPPNHLNRRDIGKLRSADAWTMTTAQIDDYLDWHQEHRLKQRQDNRHMLRLFPLEIVRRERSAVEETETDIDARYQKTQETCLSVVMPPSAKRTKGKNKTDKKKSPSPSFSKPAHPSVGLAARNFAHYRKESELPETAYAFYSKAAYLGGITMRMLVQSVYKLERRWRAWAKVHDAEEEAVRIQSEQGEEESAVGEEDVRIQDDEMDQE